MKKRINTMSNYINTILAATIKTNLKCTDGGIPNVEIMQNTTPLVFTLLGNSPNQAEGQFILQSEPNDFLNGKTLRVLATFKESLPAGCRTVVENYRIEQGEFGPYIIIIMRSGASDGFNQYIDGCLDIEIFAEMCQGGTRIEDEDMLAEQ